MTNQWTRLLSVTAVLIPCLLVAACAAPNGEVGSALTTTPDVTPATTVVSTPPAAPVPTAAANTLLESLGNIAYQGILEETVTLAGGYYEGEPFVEGGTSRPVVQLLAELIAQGDLNGDGQVETAVLLASNSGGSGTYLYLATVELRDGTWINLATTPLGGRVQPQNLAIEDSRIALELLSHDEDDPACCPSVAATRWFQLDGEHLVEVVD